MQVIKLRVKPCVSTLKKDDDKEMMADIASVTLLLAVSEERLQQIMEAKEVDSVFRQITTHCFKKWPDKHSLIKKDAIKTNWQYKWNSLLHRTWRIQEDHHSHLRVIRNPRKDP